MGESPDQQTFVWPPRRVDAAAVVTPSREETAQAVRRAVELERAERAPNQPAAVGRKKERGRWATLWSAMEREWLDVTCPPLRERAEALGWAPSDPADYCWRCGQTVGEHEVSTDGCAACRGTRTPWDRVVRLGEYRDPMTRFVHEVKFTRWRKLGVELGVWLGEQVERAMDEARGRGERVPSRVVVVPAPMSWRRRMVTGVDHAGVISRGVAREIRARVDQRMLRRRFGPKQLGSTAEARARNLAGMIEARNGRDLSGTLVVIVDDVMTTGATMRAVARGVMGAGRRWREARGGDGRGQRRTEGEQGPVIWVAVLAVTPVDGGGRVKTPRDAGTDEGVEGRGGG